MGSFCLLHQNAPAKLFSYQVVPKTVFYFKMFKSRPLEKLVTKRLHVPTMELIEKLVEDNNVEYDIVEYCCGEPRVSIVGEKQFGMSTLAISCDHYHLGNNGKWQYADLLLAVASLKPHGLLVVRLDNEEVSDAVYSSRRVKRPDLLMRQMDRCVARLCLVCYVAQFLGKNFLLIGSSRALFDPSSNSDITRRIRRLSARTLARRFWVRLNRFNHISTTRGLTCLSNHAEAATTRNGFGSLDENFAISADRECASSILPWTFAVAVAVFANLCTGGNDLPGFRPKQHMEMESESGESGDDFDEDFSSSAPSQAIMCDSGSDITSADGEVEQIGKFDENAMLVSIRRRAASMATSGAFGVFEFVVASLVFRHAHLKIGLWASVDGFDELVRFSLACFVQRLEASMDFTYGKSFLKWLRDVDEELMSPRVDAGCHAVGTSCTFGAVDSDLLTCERWSGCTHVVLADVLEDHRPERIRSHMADWVTEHGISFDEGSQVEELVALYGKAYRTEFLLKLPAEAFRSEHVGPHILGEALGLTVIDIRCMVVALMNRPGLNLLKLYYLFNLCSK